MGVWDNIRKIKRYSEHVGKERELETKIIKHSEEDSKFIHDYATFVEGLKDKLMVLFEENDYEIVFFEPNNIESARFFRNCLYDKEFRAYYHIEQTKGGEFSFRLKSLDEDLYKEEDEVLSPTTVPSALSKNNTDDDGIEYLDDYDYN